MKTNRLSVTAMIVLAVFLFVIVSAPFSLIFGIHHDCTGEHCHVCALILACVSAYVHLTRAATAIAAFAAGVLCLAAAERIVKTGGRRADLAGKGIRLLN